MCWPACKSALLFLSLLPQLERKLLSRVFSGTLHYTFITATTGNHYKQPLQVRHPCPKQTLAQQKPPRVDDVGKVPHEQTSPSSQSQQRCHNTTPACSNEKRRVGWRIARAGRRLPTWHSVHTFPFPSREISGLSFSLKADIGWHSLFPPRMTLINAHSRVNLWSGH